MSIYLLLCVHTPVAVVVGKAAPGPGTLSKQYFLNKQYFFYIPGRIPRWYQQRRRAVENEKKKNYSSAAMLHRRFYSYIYIVYHILLL